MAWLASACSSDSNVDFGSGADDTSLGASSSGGSALSVSGSHSGATASGGTQTTGGVASAGSSAQAGSENTGGTSDTGGNNTGGTATGGSASGGKGGSNAMAGAAGKGGMGGGGMSGAGAGGMGGGGTSNGGAAGGGMGGGGMAGGGTGGTSSCVPQTEVCDGVDNDCDDAIDPPGTCPDGCTGASYGGHAYFFCSATGTAAAALGKCAGAGMAMVSIESAAENVFVYGKVKGTSWLGGSDALKEDTWKWTSTGSTFWNGKAVDGVYNNFMQGQPNDNGQQGGHENCLVIYAGTGVIGQNSFWNDLGCDLTLYRAACESTGP